MVLHFLESSKQTKERNFDDFQLQRTGKRSLKAKVQQLPTMKIIPHKIPSSFNSSKSEMFVRNDFLPLLWKTQRYLNKEKQDISYRFVGWVTSMFKVSTPKTVMTFLPVIRNPITQYSTVLKCIHQATKYADVCNMKYVHLITDEGAAQKFYQVVWNNEEKFRKVLIHLGDSHGMMEHFSVIGKIVSNSVFRCFVPS